ncbi:MAG: glycosyltransferase [Gammaproteobacteria bacterium]
MRLLFVADHLKFGGAERHTVALAKGLAARGHQVAVAYLKPHDELAEDLRQGGVGLVECCQSQGGLDRAALGRLRGLIRRFEADLVIATSQYSLMFATLARALARQGKLAFICHSMEHVQRSRADRLRFLVYRQFYRRAACVVFVSALQRDFFAQLGIVPRRSEVIHNGIDLRRFDPAAVQDEAVALRQRHGVPADDLLIGLCAVFREEKRQVDLVDALARLRAEGVAARVLLVGDGLMRPQIEQRIAQHGLQSAVILAGFQQDVRPWIAMCDVMALTSHAETFPIATLEYMALGKPLVASAVGGMREQVEDGVNGLLYPAADIGALTAALGQVAAPATRARLRQGALSTVSERFDLVRMVERYEAVWSSLL